MQLEQSAGCPRVVSKLVPIANRGIGWRLIIGIQIAFACLGAIDKVQEVARFCETICMLEMFQFILAVRRGFLHTAPELKFLERLGAARKTQC